MTQELILAPKRTRASTSKVRTGCITCKARRVKCDEGKPICQRCTVGGRDCEYSTARVTAPRRRLFTVYLPPVEIQPGFFKSDRGTCFFHQNLAVSLDGQFNSQFWSRLVLQLSHSEPAVRNAVSAISIIYQDVELSLRHPAGYVDANPEGQRQWTAAVNNLSTQIRTHPDSHLVSLVCCLLFTCIEFLRGNIESSLLHAQSGFNILATIHRIAYTDAAPGPICTISPNDLKAIEEHIVPVFSSLNVLCSLAARMMPPIYVLTATEDSPHQDLSDSRQRLVEISDICIRFMHNAISKAAVFQTEMEDFVEQFKLQTRLDAWHGRLNKLVGELEACGKLVKQDALNLLLVHYKVIYIWIRVCTIAGETALDNYHKDFEELVHYAEQFAKPDTERPAPQPLSFEIQILGPLHYAALKCRHPIIRRRALKLLKFAPRREGLWNGHYAYVTAKRVIELEEMYLDEQGLPAETSRVYGLPLPSDEPRIYNPNETPFDLRNIDYTIVPSPACPGTIKFVFQTKPWGLLGEWHTTTEYLKL